jgi:hypothetical protein
VKSVCHNSFTRRVGWANRSAAATGCPPDARCRLSGAPSPIRGSPCSTRGSRDLGGAAVEVGREPLPPAQCGNAGLAPQPLGHDADLLLRRVPVARHSADLPNGGFYALLLLGHFASRFAVQGAGSVSTQITPDFPLGLTTYA